MSAVSPLPANQERDGIRIRRLMARFIGGGYVAYTITSLIEMSADAAIVASWWTPVAIALSLGPGLLLLGASF